MHGPMHVYEVYIRTTPGALWQAITRPEFTARYFYGSSIEATFEPGTPYVYRLPDGSDGLNGMILEVEEGRRLVMTFEMTHHPDAREDAPSRVAWHIEPLGETCKLTLVHDGFEGETATFRAVARGWNPVLSGLKTLLETGKPLVIAR
jgi:uncharacterized protein YndB with AHSA1/START domain